MHDPFDLSDAVIRDLDHVRVTRQAPRDGRRCEYRKRFKPDGLRDAAYWVQRENEFLLDFALKRLRYVVELSAYAQSSDGQHTPTVESVVTYDAGLTIEDWLRVRAEYPNGEIYSHPFKHAGLFLSLMRACLVALREIHRHGIVHCDIKPDNICLPYLPYPRQPGQAIRIDFERIRLIDFAFSITPERPLEHPLPIAPEAPYQSNLLQTALRDDSRRRNRGQPVSQNLDYRVDLYSLGYLARHIVDKGLVQPGGPDGMAAMDGALDLVERLQAFDDGRKRPGRTLPHDQLIADIDALLGPLKDLDGYRQFDVARVREPGPAEAVAQPTPMTPLVRLDATPVMASVRRRRGTKWPKLPLVAAGLLGVAAGGFEYWKHRQTSVPPVPVEKPAPSAKAAPKPESASAAAKARPADAEIEAKRQAKAREDARRQAEAEAEAKLKMELAEKARLAEAEAQRKAKETDAARWKEESERMMKAELARTEQDARRREEAEIRAQALAAEAQAAAAKPSQTEAARPAADAPAAKATARIGSPAPGAEVERVAEIHGTLNGLADGQSAFLVIRSTAEQFGRLYYPQGELPRAGDWSMKGVFGTANYEYQVLVVATDDPESARLLRATRSRNFGLKELPGDTRVISRTMMVRRVR